MGSRTGSLAERFALGIALLAMMGLYGSRAQAQALPRFDFTKSQGANEWQAAHDVGALQASPLGLVIPITGNDPYIYGPRRDYPEGQPLWLTVRFQSDSPGMGQFFYFTQGATEEDSVRFPCRGGGVWEEIRLPLPPLGKGYALRFDPPGNKGKTVLASISFSARTLLKEPEWPLPIPPVFRADSFTLQSGNLRLTHVRDSFGGFALDVTGQRMAVGHSRPLIGYTLNGRLRWLNLAEHARVHTSLEKETLTVEAVADDADGGTWTLIQQFKAGKSSGAIDVRTRVSVSQERVTVFLPLLVLLPGVGSFGEAKGHALFGGLEYLDKEEPSSSEADIIGPESKRQVPSTYKITLPLMTVQANDRYIGLTWEKAPQFSALFDSPDRQFHSGGHLMGVLFPGADGGNRVEGSLLPYSGESLKKGQTLTLHATILGGQGKSVLPAVQQYVSLHGLPPTPNVGQPTKPSDQPGTGFQNYLATAAAGYLDSKIRVGNRFQHAYPGTFTASAVADVPILAGWLAHETNDQALAARLNALGKAAIAEVPPAEMLFARVSHVFYPTAALLTGHTAVAAERAAQQARDLLTRFEPDGRVLYRKSPDGLDYGKTHFAPDANGLTAQVVSMLLESASFCGDPELIRQGIEKLRALDAFDNSAPRGAQTWEVPLHTPDILASAHLVRAYTLGYELTGDKMFLDRALHWAWTGVPFVYLEPPTPQPIGLYATIPVLGATQWKAPNWMGLPVQWCGLVYADALYRLARHDPKGLWKRLADGIAASGVQQTWPRGLDSERVGLLPDSFSLLAQSRNDAAINPGTVLVNAIRLYGRPDIYDFRAFRSEKGTLLVHAPAALTSVQEAPDRVVFTVQDWTGHPYQLLIAGLTAAPKVKVNGQEISLGGPNVYQEKAGRLILMLNGKPAVEIAR